MVLNICVLYLVNFDIDEYIELGVLGFCVDFLKFIEIVVFILIMIEIDVLYLEEIKFSIN